jgi:hypothetical protein
MTPEAEGRSEAAALRVQLRDTLRVLWCLVDAAGGEAAVDVAAMGRATAAGAVLLTSTEGPRMVLRAR